MFTPNHIREIQSLIDLQHTIFIAVNIGYDVLSDFEKQLLAELGLNKQERNEFTDMHSWGYISSLIGHKRAQQMTYDQLMNFISLNNLELNRDELYRAQLQAASDIRGLGNKISRETGQLMIDADLSQRRRYEKIIAKETSEAIMNNSSRQQLVSNLGHKTGDWSRDFARIADYVMHQAFDAGRATQILAQHGEEAEVYKTVYAGACKHCIRLYLTKGIGSEPIVYKLVDIMQNGSNIGRKVEDWKPVLGSTHPHSLVDGNTNVLTDCGYKPIKNIKIGDYVLTHKGRFKKVIGKINRYVVPQNYNIKEFYNIKYIVKNRKDNSNIIRALKLTAEHKILTQRGWVEAQNLKLTDKLFKTLIPCSNKDCNNYIDFCDSKGRRTCSKKCESNISRQNIINNCHNEITRDKISQTVKQHWVNGIYDNTLIFVRSKEHREKVKNRMLNGGAQKARRANSNGGASKIQIKLYNKIKTIYPDAELEYPFFNKSLDIAIPSLKINIEYDGSNWHNGREDFDALRDEFIKSKGWHVIRYRDIFPSYKKINDDIALVSSNSQNLYKFEMINILKIKKYKLISNYHKLYDIEVEDDNSFVARGIVIHNCRCTIMHKDKNYVWSEEEKSFNKPKEYTRKVQRRSKAVIQIGNTSYEV